jgi:hypothetical protein
VQNAELLLNVKVTTGLNDADEAEALQIVRGSGSMSCHKERTMNCERQNVTDVLKAEPPVARNALRA